MKSEELNSHERMKINLKDNIRILIKRIRFKLEKNCDVAQELLDLYTNAVELKKIKKAISSNDDRYFSLNLNTEEQLLVLEKLEAWYSRRNLSFPNQEWLEKQRAKLKIESTR